MWRVFSRIPSWSRSWFRLRPRPGNLLVKRSTSHHRSACRIARRSRLWIPLCLRSRMTACTSHHRSASKIACGSKLWMFSCLRSRRTACTSYHRSVCKIARRSRLWTFLCLRSLRSACSIARRSRFWTLGGGFAFYTTGARPESHAGARAESFFRASDHEGNRGWCSACAFEAHVRTSWRWQYQGFGQVQHVLCRSCLGHDPDRLRKSRGCVSAPLSRAHTGRFRQEGDRCQEGSEAASSWISGLPTRLRSRMLGKCLLWRCFISMSTRLSLAITWCPTSRVWTSTTCTVLEMSWCPHFPWWCLHSVLGKVVDMPVASNDRCLGFTAQKTLAFPQLHVDVCWRSSSTFVDVPVLMQRCGLKFLDKVVYMPVASNDRCLRLTVQKTLEFPQLHVDV